MAWRDEMGGVQLPDGRYLVGGSFRGVPFRTVAAELRVGRRNQVNELPQSEDDPYVDDLGKKGRRFVLELYVIGDNYLAERDLLIDALEEKGSGELIHPRYGVKRVSVEGDASIKEGPEFGGMARIAVTFVADKSNPFPKATVNTVAQVEAATNAADEATQECFAKDFSVEGPSLLALQAISGLTSTVADVLAMARQVTSVEGLAEIVGQVGELSGSLTDLIRTPVVLVQSLRSIFAQLVQEVNRPLSALEEFQFVFFSNGRSPAVALSGSSRARSLANDTARADLQRRLSLTNQARLVAVAISDTTLVRTSDQATALRDAVIVQIDAELEVNDPPAALARALTVVRAAVVRDVAARSEFLQRRSTFTPQTVLPALVIAHRVYQDATRVEELIARNGISHPAFVPAQPLEVLR
jgi:prophage DNA circulation protein